MGVENAFCIRLAGEVIKIYPIHSYLKDYCKHYLVDSDYTPEISISVSREDIDFERDKSALEGELEGNSVRYFSDEYLETLAVYRKIAVKMLDHDTLLFHGSCIAVDGVGYLFAAPSGTGKSTHACLWRNLFQDKAVMINDDKPLLKVTDHGVTACGTPWDGKHRLSTNTSVPLKAICFLNRGESNQIEPIDFWAAYPKLLQQAYRPDDKAAMEKTLSLIEKMGETTELYSLTCNMEAEAAKVAWLGMNRGDGDERQNEL